MNAALLCPGPSLSKTWRGNFEGLKIGVNRVPLVYPCDVWAKLDFPNLQKLSADVKGNPALLTIPDTVLSLNNHGWKWRGRTITTDLFYDFCPMALNWENLTATTSLVYAAFVGATRIDCYGVDWNGVADYDGDMSAENRSDERWVREAQRWGELVRWLGDRGVTVHRN